jgi:hypothetical protein
MNMDGTVLTSAGAREIFLASYTSAPVKNWAIREGSTGNDAGWDVTVNCNNMVYISGSFNGSAVGLTSAGAADLFYSVYNTSGVRQSSVRAGGTLDDGLAATLGFDSYSRLFVAGSFSSAPAAFGGFNINAVSGSQDVFLARYDLAPIIITSNVSTTCAAPGSVVLTANPNIPGADYTWYTPAVAGLLTQDVAGNMTVGATGAFTNYAVNDYVLLQGPVYFGQYQITAKTNNDLATISATNLIGSASSVSISFSAGVRTAGNTYTPTHDGTYFVYVTGPSCGAISNILTVTFAPVVGLSASVLDLCYYDTPNTTSTITASGAVSYSWSHTPTSDGSTLVPSCGGCSTAVLTVPSGNISDHQVTVIGTGSNGCTDSENIWIVGCPLGNNGDVAQNYPNPATGITTIPYWATSSAHIRFYTSLNVLYYSQPVSAGGTPYSFTSTTVDVTAWPSGSYYYKLDILGTVYGNTKTLVRP